MEGGMPQVTPRKLFRTAMLGVALVVSLGLVVTCLYLRIFAGTVNQRLPSPNGQLVAEVRTLTSLSALDRDFVTVQLSRRFNPFRHIVFGGSDYGVKITVSWTDSEDLLVQCVDCDNLRDETVENNWNGVTIHYELLSSRKTIDDYLNYLKKSQGQRAPQHGDL